MNLPRAHHRLSMTPSFWREARLIYDIESPEPTPDPVAVARIMEETERTAALNVSSSRLDDDPSNPPPTPQQTTDDAQREQEQKALITRMLTAQDQLVRQMEAELRQTYQDKIDALAEKRSLDELINRATERGGNVNIPKWTEERQAASDRFNALDALQKSLFAQLQPAKERLNAMLAGDPAAFTALTQSQSQFAPPALPGSAPGSAPTDAGSSTSGDLASQAETLEFKDVDSARKAEIQKILDQFNDDIEEKKRTDLVSQLLMQGVQNAKKWEESGKPKPEDLQIYKMGTFPFMICVISGMVMQLKNLFPKKAEKADEDAGDTREELKKKIEDKKKEIEDLKKTPLNETPEAHSARQSQIKTAEEALVELEDQLAQKTWEEATADLQDLKEDTELNEKQKGKLGQLATLVTGENAPKEQLRVMLDELGERISELVKTNCNEIIQKESVSDELLQKAQLPILLLIARNAEYQRDTWGQPSIVFHNTGSSIPSIRAWKDHDEYLNAFEDLMR